MSDGIRNVSRRAFLEGMFSAGALVLSVPVWLRGTVLEVDQAAVGMPASLADRAVLHPSVFLGIETDGTVYIIAARSEMGTGITTSLPQVVADELDADWTRVKIRQALGDARYGNQDTDGSHSVRSFFDTMRVAGGTARLMLMRAAAAEWGVAVSACATELHAVVYRPAGAHGDPAGPRRLEYGQLAAAAAKLPVPAREEQQLKPRNSWRYIGKEAKLYNLREIVTGQPLYGIDANVPGMLFASIEHPPVLGSVVGSFVDKEALEVAGVRRTV